MAFRRGEIILYLWVNIILFLPLVSLAQEEAVSVEGVRFRTEKIAGVTDDWAEIEVEIIGGPSLDPGALRPRYNDHIKVILSLGYELEVGRRKSFRFFRSEAVVAALEQGRRVKVLFYLPPEIVKRDRLSRRPYAYLVELEVNGMPLRVGPGNVSSNLADNIRWNNFKARVAAEGSGNDGVLLPIYYTPFYAIDFSGKLQDSPGFVIKSRR